MTTENKTFLECSCGEIWGADESPEVVWNCSKCRQYLYPEDFATRTVKLYVAGEVAWSMVPGDDIVIDGKREGTWVVRTFH